MESKNKDQAKNWAMWCHLASFAGVFVPVVGNVLGPFLVWQLKKDEFPSIESHAKESLNFQISVAIYTLIAGISIFLLIGFLLLPAIFIAQVVLVIKAAMAANNGQEYHYPFTIKIIN